MVKEVCSSGTSDCVFLSLLETADWHAAGLLSVPVHHGQPVWDGVRRRWVHAEVFNFRVFPLGYMLPCRGARVLPSHLATWARMHWNLASVARGQGRGRGLKRLNAPCSLFPSFKSLLSHSLVFISPTVFQARWNERPVLKTNHSTLRKTSRGC